MVHAQTAESSAEEMDNRKKHNTLNASQTNALPTKFCSLMEVASNAAHTRKPTLTREPVSNQLAVPDRNFSKMLLSLTAQNTPELVKIAEHAVQTNAHWDKNSYQVVNARTALITREPLLMEKAARQLYVKRTKSSRLMLLAKPAHHSQRLHQVILSVSTLTVRRLRDFSQAVNARTAKPTQELSPAEELVLQISVPPDKRSSKMEHVSLATTSREPLQVEENAQARSVPHDRSF